MGSSGDTALVTVNVPSGANSMAKAQALATLLAPYAVKDPGFGKVGRVARGLLRRTAHCRSTLQCRTARCSLQAQMIQPHPYQPSAWCSCGGAQPLSTNHTGQG